jgi:hypothetical protein
MKLRLMPDYECYPLWESRAAGAVNVDPADLPISDRLRQELRAWAQQYDATLNRHDPASSGFADREAEQAFEQEGLRLWQALRDELGPAADVSYFSQLAGEDIA